ncbi:MAG: zinc-binding alcohol dehydrogenase family protein [Xanthomonadales bacterium]|nr:zinc-binding alcohol dehydrogenase family protein [Xanthomonadales bacterium]
MSEPRRTLRMVLERPRTALRPQRAPAPEPGPYEVLIAVVACGVCRTDLHIADGELALARYPVVPGHEVVGEVVAAGPGVEEPRPGARVGVPWLAWTCGRCRHCRRGRENLCERARFTGCTHDGGYATHLVADARYVFPLPAGDALAQAPLLCAGLIGYRALRLAGEEAGRLGLYGFGASAHLLAQLARWQGRTVYAFTRPGDRAAQALALRLGCAWAGGSDERPPEPLDAALIFAPVGDLVPKALSDVERGGVVVCAGIHASDIPGFPYALLWGERTLRSVAHLTRRDGEEFLALAARAGLRAETVGYRLERGAASPGGSSRRPGGRGRRARLPSVAAAA